MKRSVPHFFHLFLICIKTVLDEILHKSLSVLIENSITATLINGLCFSFIFFLFAYPTRPQSAFQSFQGDLVLLLICETLFNAVILINLLTPKPYCSHMYTYTGFYYKLVFFYFMIKRCSS